ncbi:MAG: RidA family protein [Deltaproteobacteria bacterium]|nr:RidA family protein [Candidatus Anaeroferrophillus wilburensis]MBN2888914.1 RidA family protein [Deltaproteobacteria bacterium]
MTISRIATSSAPQAIGPYSQGIRAGDFLFLAGQIPMDPAGGRLVAGGIQEQTRQVLENLQAVLKAAGAGLSQVVKTEVFLQSMEDFAAMNEVYGSYFTTDPQPARQAIEAARLPKGALVEISCIAYLGTV